MKDQEETNLINCSQKSTVTEYQVHILFQSASILGQEVHNTTCLNKKMKYYIQ